jgi:pimeloyl-ACP methyl ester carboxylesterase
VAVPLDRHDPASKLITVQFELHARRSLATPSLGTLVAMEGGPGFSTTAGRYAYLELFRPLRDHRDVLLVDARGTGRSGALDCPFLQKLRGSFHEAAAGCAGLLGASATRYGSGDAAEDLVAVLDSLAIGRIDLYGDSYGSFNAQTFAVRHPERVRSLVLDGAYPIAGLDPWYRDAPRALSRALAVVCARSRACPTSPAGAVDEVAMLATRLATAPRKRADVDGLITAALSADRVPTVYREIGAAARALAAGDTAPLTRLVAETSGGGDGGPASLYSEAHYLAVTCRDYPQLWDPAAPVAARRDQFTAARLALPADAFTPFGRDAFAASRFMAYDACLSWPGDALAEPPLPAGVAYPDVPTLVLSGDLDQRTSSELGRVVAASFPNSTFVEVANAGHVTALGDLRGCSSVLVRRFMRTLAAGDTSCAGRAYAPVRVLPAFVRRVADATPARPQRGDRSTPIAHRATTVAALTVSDAIGRWWSTSGFEFPGLRGGSVAIGGVEPVAFAFQGARFAKDLAVSGRASWNRRTDAVSARLELRGAVEGELRLRWRGERATATGTLDGRRVVLALPAP